MTDMYLTIHIQHDTVVYLTLNFHPKGESTALRLNIHLYIQSLDLKSLLNMDKSKSTYSV
jgi:hypothetical protein